MPLTRERKAEEIATVTTMVEESAAVYVTDFMGLTVEQINMLRGQFYESGVKYRVVKNTLLRKALESIGGYDDLIEHLAGPTAIALCPEPSIPARVIRKFKTDSSQSLPTLRAAFVDGTVYDGEQIDFLASLKSREELIGDVIGLLLSAISNVIGAVQAPGATLAAILETLQEKDAES